ncbi:MAG: YfhO family protein, partial [Chloroflexi bacterium]|nr:YfhO family protein [Chloroflexota bacterium]
HGSWLAAALAGLALALQMPTHIQIPYYTAALGSAYWLWHVAPHLWRVIRRQPGEWRRIGQLTLAGVIWLASFAALAAVVLLPLVEILPYNNRADFTLADANRYALPPALLFTLLTPSNFQFPEWMMFPGVSSPLLAAIARLGKRRDAFWFFALVIGFALIYALGTSTPLFGLAFAIVPGLRLLRVPTRLWFFGGLALAVLAGLGADALADAQLRDKLWQYRRGLGGAAGVYFAAGGAALAGNLAMFGRWDGLLALQLITAAIIVALGWGWLSSRIDGAVLQWALIPVVLLDLLPLAGSQIDLVNPRDAFLRSTPALDFVASRKSLFRVYSPAGDLPYAVAAELGVESLDGLLNFQLAHSASVIREATGCGNASYATAIPPCLTDRLPTAVPDAERLGQLNVRFVLSHSPLNDSDFKLALDGSPAVYENLRWKPRARLTPRPSLPSEDALTGGRESRAEIVSRSAGEYEIAVKAAEAARLIVSEAWAPGWQATSGRQSLAVERAEGALIGVAVPPGDHLIHLFYSPLGWRIGWPISMAALAGLAVWVVTSRRRTRQT